MTPSPLDISSGGNAALLAVWRSATLDAGWLHPADWYVPPVVGLLAAIEGGLVGAELRQAAVALGAERARRGTGLSESIADLALVFELHGHRQAPVEIVKAFAQEWTEVTLGGILDRGIRDPFTGLVTHDYLCERIAETYAEPHRRPVAARRCLVVIEPRMRELPGWQRLARASSVARVIRSVFDTGQTSASLQSGNFAVLVRRDDVLAESMIRLRRELSRVRLQGVARFRMERLPHTAVLAQALLSDL